MSHRMFLLCIAEGLRERRCESQDQVQGDRVTWRVGSLFTKCNYSSQLDILVVQFCRNTEPYAWMPRKNLRQGKLHSQFIVTAHIDFLIFIKNFKF